MTSQANLPEFVSSLSRYTNPNELVSASAVRIAEVLEADIVVVLRSGVVLAIAGLARNDEAIAGLDAALCADPPVLETGVGPPVPLSIVSVHGEVEASLIIGRSEPLDQAETANAQAMVRVLMQTISLMSALEKERRMRTSREELFEEGKVRARRFELLHAVSRGAAAGVPFAETVATALDGLQGLDGAYITMWVNSASVDELGLSELERSSEVLSRAASWSERDPDTVQAELLDADGALVGRIFAECQLGGNACSQRFDGWQLTVDALATELQLALTAYQRGEELDSARQDATTGLFNYAGIEDFCSDAARRGEHWGLILLQVGGLATVNEIAGYGAGDEFLQRVGKEVRLHGGLYDRAARLSGSEFVLVSQTSLSEMETTARHLVDSIRDLELVDDTRLRPTVSVGLCEPVDDNNVETLIRRAELARLTAVGEHNTIGIYNDDLGNRHVDQRDGIQRMRSGLANDEFSVHFQPIVQLDSRQLRGFEALVRWEDPDRGLVSPAEFVPMAERTGMISMLGQRVLELSSRFLVECVEVSPESDLKVSVNVSPWQLGDPGFPSLAADIVRSSGVDPALVCLEITETALGEDRATVAEALHQLKERGFTLALDDFGTGYSSLAHIADFPFDRLKIDRSFVSPLPARSAQAIVRSIIELANSLELELVAEGVELQAQASTLMAMRVPLGQGFLFDRPLPWEEAANLAMAQEARQGSERSVGGRRLTFPGTTRG